MKAMHENLRANNRSTLIATRSTRRRKHPPRITRLSQQLAYRMCVGHNQATTGKHCTRASSATNAPCKHDVFNIHMVTSDLVYKYKIVNGLFSHEFSAQVPYVCGDNGVMAARVLDGRPGTTS